MCKDTELRIKKKEARIMTRNSRREFDFAMTFFKPQRQKVFA